MVRRGGGRGPLGAVFVTVIEGQRIGGEGRGLAGRGGGAGVCSGALDFRACARTIS